MKQIAEIIIKCSDKEKINSCRELGIETRDKIAVTETGREKIIRMPDLSIRIKKPQNQTKDKSYKMDIPKPYKEEESEPETKKEEKVKDKSTLTVEIIRNYEKAYHRKELKPVEKKMMDVINSNLFGDEELTATIGELMYQKQKIGITVEMGDGKGNEARKRLDAGEYEADIINVFGTTGLLLKGTGMWKDVKVTNGEGVNGKNLILGSDYTTGYELTVKDSGYVADKLISKLECDKRKKEELGDEVIIKVVIKDKIKLLRDRFPATEDDSLGKPVEFINYSTDLSTVDLLARTIYVEVGGKNLDEIEEGMYAVAQTIYNRSSLEAHKKGNYTYDVGINYNTGKVIKGTFKDKENELRNIVLTPMQYTGLTGEKERKGLGHKEALKPIKTSKKWKLAVKVAKMMENNPDSIPELEGLEGCTQYRAGYMFDDKNRITTYNPDKHTAELFGKKLERVYKYGDNIFYK